MYNKHEGTLVGFVNLGDTNLLQFEAALQGDPPQQQHLRSKEHARIDGLWVFLKGSISVCTVCMCQNDWRFADAPVWEAISWLE